MNIEEILKKSNDFVTYKRSIGECVLNTTGKAKRCNQCYKYWYRRCEDL